MNSLFRRNGCCRALWALLATCALGSGTEAATTINVPADQPTIAAGVAAAAAGDTVLVAAGTYVETAGIHFAVNNVTLQGSGAVVLQGPASEDSLLYVNGGVTGIHIQNITVDRATANSSWMRCINAAGNSSLTLDQCTLQGPGCGVGLILFNSADTTVTNCTFGNFNAGASWAGAVAVEGNGGTGYSDILIADSTFATGCNKWLASTGSTAPKLGAITFRNNTCQAARARAALYFQASCVFDNTKPVLFENCVMNGTTQELVEMLYGSPGPQSLTFRKIRIPAYDGTRRVFYYDLPTPTVFEDVVIAGGKHQVLVRVWGGPPSVNFRHCTLINDGASAAEGSGGTAGSSIIDGWDGGRTFQVRNCIFYSPANYTAALVGDSGSSANRTYDIAYSIVSHATPVGAMVTLNSGTNYSNATPLFSDAAGRDYSLAPGSPGLGDGIDLGYTTDVLGAARPNPAATPPDIGAYESVLVPVELSGFEVR